jgi:hypothetical protein
LVLQNDVGVVCADNDISCGMVAEVEHAFMSYGEGLREYEEVVAVRG